MEETSSYPPIDPSNFDLIVIGTGLPESILASAASAAGKTVLHLDPNPFYGTHYASFPLNDLISFLQSHSQFQCQSQPSQPSSDYSAIPLATKPLYSELEVNSYSSEPEENSRKFNLDLAGPRLFFCSDSMIDLILKTGINQYLEFKSVDISFMSDAEGNLGNVPDSRSAIFKNRNISLTEKNQLMKFFKLVQGHLVNENEDDKISEQDMDSPFVDFLTKMGLSQKLKSIILYAIVLANYDQSTSQGCKDFINTKTGINRLALYHSSIGRFNANGAIIYPIYGQGELPQAFCRRAAVKGCIHVLRMPTVAVLMDKDNGTYKGVKLATGQELFSSQLVLAPSFTIPSTLTTSALVDNSQDAEKMIARGICIAKKSIKPDVANCMVFFPPRSLYSNQITSVRVMQLSGNLAVCPPEMFVTYVSTMSDNAAEGKKSLNAAINALFSTPVSGNSDSTTDNQFEHMEEKPSLLWSALYIQELTTFQDTYDCISYTNMPDEHLHCIDILEEAEKLFKKIYPNEEFFAATKSADENVDDDGPDPVL